MRRAAALVALGLAVTACADDGEDLPSDTRAPIVDPTTVPPGTGTSPPPPTQPPPLSEAEVRLEPVAELAEPIAMAVRPGEDERVYVAERAGVVRDLSLEDGSSEVVLDISQETTVESERGLLGLAVHPSGEHLYVSFTNADGDSRIVEYAIAEDGTLDESSRRIVFAQDQPFPNHNGGHVTFGPDGYLYVGLGDGGNRGDPLQAGQDRSQLLGSLLRIDPRGGGGSAYAVPSDNPYVGQEGARPEVWLKGVRNPWRFSFDRATGDLWIGDVGQNVVEEIDLLPAEDGRGAGRGANLGWNELEGDRPFEDGVAPEGAVPPVFTYTHADGSCSVTGGYVYRGSEIPALFGAYVFTDYCTGVLTALEVEGGRVVDDVPLLPDPVNGVISFGEGPDGELYVLTQPGQVARLARA
ncbi:MAG TPA: PQQ-dependent sugar dehydrogenase [Acidimicrobiales bacterium]|nr:PQQ-dependent sugar dehydrogenase [Acidimicrobiales bacterium]